MHFTAERGLGTSEGRRRGKERVCYREREPTYTLGLRCVLTAPAFTTAGVLLATSYTNILIVEMFYSCQIRYLNLCQKITNNWQQVSLCLFREGVMCA